MRTSISTLQLFTSIFLGTLNTIAAIYVTSLLKFNVIFFITMWAYYANSLYLLIVMICDISFYCKSTKLEHINTFFRNKYSIISMPYSYFVSFAFWLRSFVLIHFSSFDIFRIVNGIQCFYLRSRNTAYRSLAFP